jgi:hypothetical protein
MTKEQAKRIWTAFNMTMSGELVPEPEPARQKRRLIWDLIDWATMLLTYFR